MIHGRIILFFLIYHTTVTRQAQGGLREVERWQARLEPNFEHPGKRLENPNERCWQKITALLAKPSAAEMMKNQAAIDQKPKSSYSCYKRYSMQQQAQAPPAALATSIKIPGELRAQIQSLAEARRRTPHALMLQALETYVTHEEQREALRQDGIAAWEEYQRTGLHLTGDEVRGWIEQLRQGKKAPMPKCHG